jgi:hypothetical protein
MTREQVMDDRPGKDARLLPTLEQVFQPWELTGDARRDCAPHRANLLIKMARLSLVAAGLSFFGLPVNLIGLPLGLGTWAMACHDRDRICAGDMDQTGYHPTEKARSDSRAAVFLNILAIPMALCGGSVVLLRLSIR